MKTSLALAALLLTASSAGVANAQVPTIPDGPMTLSPGTQPTTSAQAAKNPGVIIVGPDGNVVGGGDTPAGPGGYYVPSDGSGGRDSVHFGPVPEFHVVRSGDTLWDICYFYFNDPWQWPKIWSYNPQITNPHWIYPRDLVRLLPRSVSTSTSSRSLVDPPGRSPWLLPLVLLGIAGVMVVGWLVWPRKDNGPEQQVETVNGPQIAPPLPWYRLAQLDFAQPVPSEVLDILSNAYIERPRARSLAARAGLELSRLNLDQAPVDRMRDILELAAVMGRLEKLLDVALGDQDIAAVHARLAVLKAS